MRWRRSISAVPAAGILAGGLLFGNVAGSAASATGLPAAAAWACSGGPLPAWDALAGVAVLSARAAWAVGADSDGCCPGPLIARWNGTRWQQVPVPAVRGYPVLSGVTATSARNAWAVGGGTSARQPNKTLILH